MSGGSSPLTISCCPLLQICFSSRSPHFSKAYFSLKIVHTVCKVIPDSCPPLPAHTEPTGRFCQPPLQTHASYFKSPHSCLDYCESFQFVFSLSLLVKEIFFLNLKIEGSYSPQNMRIASWLFVDSSQDLHSGVRDLRVMFRAVWAPSHTAPQFPLWGPASPWLGALVDLSAWKHPSSKFLHALQVFETFPITTCSLAFLPPSFATIQHSMPAFAYSSSPVGFTLWDHKNCFTFPTLSTGKNGYHKHWTNEW